MQPMNYTIDTGNAGNSFSQGFQNAAGMMATVADYQKAQAMATLAQQKAAADEQKRMDFAAAAQDPTTDSVRNLMLKYPELSEGIKRSYDTLNEREKANTQEVSFSLLSALEKGKGDTASQLIDNQIEAAKASGNQTMQKRYEMLKNAVIANPDAVRFSLKGALFSTMGEKYGDLMEKLGKAETADATRQYDIQKAQGEAGKAQAEGQYTGQKMKQDLENSKLDRQIKIMEAELKKTDSESKRQEIELKLEEARTKRDDAMRTKTADVESARSSIDNFLNTADRLTKNPMLSRVLGPIEGRFSSAPLSDEAADAVALIDTLKSQAFLSQIPSMKGTGALSEKEGAKLESALTNLSRVQSEKQFMENLEEAKKILQKARKNAADRAGVPDDKAASPLDRLLQKYVK